VLIIAKVVEIDVDYTEYTNEAEDTSFITKIFVKHDELINEAEDIYLSIYSNEFAINGLKKINFAQKRSCISQGEFNNPKSQTQINKIINNHNHLLSIKQISFEKNKKFSSEMLEDIKFLTSIVNWAIVQQKFLERKYLVQPIHSKDLYTAMQKFQPTSKLLSNNAALIFSWLNKQKKRHYHDGQEIEIQDVSLVETQQILLNKHIYLVEEMDNIIKVWFVKVVMLMTDNTKFYIWLIPSCWYNNNANISKEHFLNSDKFYKEKSIEEMVSSTTYLYSFESLFEDSSKDSSEDDGDRDKENQ
ncbi:5551_t:CDS:2, partial [Gigaspora margarita]